MLRTLVHRLTFRPRLPAPAASRRDRAAVVVLRAAAVSATLLVAVVGVGLTTTFAVSAAGHPAVAAVAFVAGTAVLFAMPVLAAWGAVALLTRLTR